MVNDCRPRQYKLEPRYQRNLGGHMSVELHLLTVVVRKDALETMPVIAREQVLTALQAAPDLFREDAYLAATSFMGPRDVGDFLGSLFELGFPGSSDRGTWTNLAVVDQFEGPTQPALWLQWAPPFAWEEINPFELFGGRSVVRQAAIPSSKDKIPRLWLDGELEGELSEVPYLAREPEARGRFYYMRNNPADD